MKKAQVSATANARKRVVIIGGGFGGLETAKRLRKANVQVTLIDRRNYHLFQPLLYQVATGGLSPANIATPLRYVLRKQKNCEVLLAEVVDIDVENQVVILNDGELTYDVLVIAAGATHSYFGHAEWAPYAPGLKSIADATEIRRRIFIAFEAAERETNPVVRRSLMTFVIVGGGPTGVELAGALSEIARHTLKHDFRHINPSEARIVIVEAAPRVLAHYPANLCEKAANQIRVLGIEIQTNTKVTAITKEHVTIATADGESQIATHTVIWAAGVQANPLGQIVAGRAGIAVDRAGRVPVTPHLTVGSIDNIYVIGDLAACLDPLGKPLPGLAPVAMQQGDYVAQRISASVNQAAASKPFQYRDRGSMATIGRAAAVALIGRKQFSGLTAWLLWIFIHLMQIVLFENRLLILLQWGWNYVTFNRSSRIITGEERVVLISNRSDKPELPA